MFGSIASSIVSSVASSIFSLFVNSDPIPNFYFMVGIGGPVSAAAGIILTPGYTEVTGLSIGFKDVADDITEVGAATAVPFPKGLKNEELSLKRYVRYNFFDPMSNWCKKTFTSGKTWATGVELKDVYISIHHPSTKAPVCIFHLSKAYPVKWEVESLNSMGNEALQETIILRYRNIERIL